MEGVLVMSGDSRVSMRGEDALFVFSRVMPLSAHNSQLPSRAVNRVRHPAAVGWPLTEVRLDYALQGL